MSTISVAPTDAALKLLLASFPTLSLTRTSEQPSVSQLVLDNQTVAGSNTIASHLATLIPAFKDTEYSDIEQAEISQWLTLSANVTDEALDALNANLKFRTTILGEKFSIADVVVYGRVKEAVAGWSDEQRTGENGRRHVVRWVDYIQNAPQLGLEIPEAEKVAIDASKVLFHPKPEEAVKVKKPAAGAAAPAADKKGDKPAAAKDAAKDAAPAAAAAAAGKQKKEKKEKIKREPAPPKAEALISPSIIDLRVGHILHCRPHPNADSLFVSTIAMGDPAGAPVTTPASDLESVLPADVLAKFSPLPPCRTVCSGLNGLVPIEEMQDRLVVVVANLKPVTMRGIKSAAMVLAASPPPAPGAEEGHKKEKVELVYPPAECKAGEKVWFEGYEGTPEAQLNPKKKMFEMIQPGFKSTEGLEIAFNREKAGWTGEAAKGKVEGAVEAVLKTEKGVCKTPTISGANVS